MGCRRKTCRPFFLCLKKRLQAFGVVYIENDLSAVEANKDGKEVVPMGGRRYNVGIQEGDNP